MVQPVESVLIAGTGFAAWASAALLARVTAGRVSLLVVDAGSGDDATADALMGSCRPEIPATHYAYGIEEPAFMRATSATFNLGTIFKDWSAVGRHYIHGYGDIGARLGPVAFHQTLSRMRLAGAAIPDIEECSLAAMAARGARFAHPVADKNSVGSTFSYGYHFDVSAATRYLQTHAERAGVRLLPGRIREVARAENGFLRELTLDGGERVSAQLFLDCSGGGSRLLGQALETPFESWERWLPCDRALYARVPRSANAPSATSARIHGAGWQLAFPLREHDEHGFFYSRAHCADPQAATRLIQAMGTPPDKTSEAMSWVSGRRRVFWSHNCIALGAAGALIDPVGGTSIQLIYNAINRLITLFPHEDCVPELVNEFNRRTIAEHERVRDFAALHFWNLSRGEMPFWREHGSVTLPETLEYRLKLFRQAGHLATCDDEVFNENDWISVLLGQGMWPAHPDPLTLSMDVAGLVTRTERLRQMIRQAADAMPMHQIYLEKLETVARVFPTPGVR